MRLLLFLLFLSCGAEEFKEQSKLEDLRVLAIVADQPEINSATTVSLTPLISYMNGEGASLDYTWEACPDPGIDFGAEVSCNEARENLKVTGSGSFDSSTLASTEYTGNTGAINVTVPAAAFTLLDTLSSEVKFNGFNYIFIITYEDNANNKSFKAIRRIVLTTRSELNSNPSFSNIIADGTTLSSFPRSKASFAIEGASEPESYEQETNVGTKSFTENVFVSWYASKGKFTFNRTETTERNEYKPSGDSGVFVAILRDNRGGVATQVISF